MPTDRRHCPGCESALRIHEVRGVELDRCQFCGGLWFDAGELESTTGRKLALELLGASSRRCACCREPLQRVSTHGVEADRCPSCFGMYLDDGELQTLAGGALGFGPGGGRSDDRCVGCGESLSGREALATTRGLACGGCATLIAGSSPSPAPAGTYPVFSFRSADRLLDVIRLALFD